MFDLEAYSKRIDTAIGVEQLLEIFTVAMQFIGLEVSSFRLLPAHGKPCDSSKTISLPPKWLINSEPSLLSSEVLRASVLARAQEQCGVFLFSASQNSVMSQHTTYTPLTNLCISLKGDDGALAVVEAKLALASTSPNEQLLRIAESIVAICYKKYQVINLDGLAQVQLTGREAQILQLASIGETKRSIADDLGVTNHAVDFHYRNIMKKYKTKKIVVAVAQAIRTGVI